MEVEIIVVQVVIGVEAEMLVIRHRERETSSKSIK